MGEPATAINTKKQTQKPKSQGHISIFFALVLISSSKADDDESTI
jgi:hypothetical protein